MLEGPHPSNTESIRAKLAREQEEHADRKATHENAKREAQERDREDYEEYVRWATREQCEHASSSDAKREQDRMDVLAASGTVGRIGVPSTDDAYASRNAAKRAWYRQQAEWNGSTLLSAIRLTLDSSYPHPDSMLDYAVREARIAAHFALMGGI